MYLNEIIDDIKTLSALYYETEFDKNGTFIEGYLHSCILYKFKTNFCHTTV